MNETALLILLAIIAVSFILVGWSRSRTSTRSSNQKSEVDQPVPVRPPVAPPQVEIQYDIDIREEPSLAREKTMTLRNSGAPAFRVQIQDVAYKDFVAKFPPISEVIPGERKSVQAEIYHNNQIAGLLRHDFVRILEEKMQDTATQNPVSLEVRVLYEDAEGTKFCSLHDIEYGPGAKKIRTSLKRNGEASEILSQSSVVA